MKLDNIDLLQLVPSFLQDDNSVKGLCVAGNYILSYLYNQINKMDYFNNLNLLDESTLDEIAKASNIYWYDDSDSKEVKIEVIKNSEKVFWMMGTTESVKQVVKDVFGEKSDIEEWHEYNGNPKYFKVNISDLLSTENIDKAYNLVCKVKNAQSQIDGFNRTNAIKSDRYFVSGTVITKMMKVGVRNV